MDRLRELIPHVRRCHSTFQMDHQITIKNGVTPYGMLRHALREWHSRLGVVREMLFGREELQVDVDELEHALHACTHETRYDRRRDEINLKRKRALFDEYTRSLNERGAELVRFYAQACALKDQIESQHGALTPELHARLEIDMWEQRWLRDAAFELLVEGRVRRPTFECITNMERESRARLMIRLMDRPGLESWLSQLDPQLPALSEEVTVAQVEEAILAAHDPEQRLRAC